MVQRDLFDLELLIKCHLSMIFLYGCFLAVVDPSFFLFLIPVFLYFFVLFVSLQPPKEENINEILGPNRRIQLRNHDPETPQSVESSYSFIAHRAAGFDGTENSISAIKLVSEVTNTKLFPQKFTNHSLFLELKKWL